MKFQVKCGGMFELDIEIEPTRTFYAVVTNKIFLVSMLLLSIIALAAFYGYQTGDYYFAKCMLEAVLKFLPKG